MDDFFTKIAGFFIESHIADLGDNIDDLHILFDEASSSSVIMRSHSDSPIHFLHDRSSQVDVIVDTYVQQL